MSKRILLLLCLVLCLAFVQGCAGKKTSPAMSQDAVSAPGDQAEAADEIQEPDAYPDSIQGFNRAVFSFNDAFITYVFSPLDTVYTGFFPPDVRNGFSNFYRNLGYPIRLINSLLQFKFDKVYKETASFAMNTFFGVGGLFNITRDMPSLHCSPEDFSQTLAYYGLGSGTYVVLPFLGSTTVRDAFGTVADSFAYPPTYVTPDAAKYGIIGHDKGNAASASLPTYKSIKEESFDHYTSMKDVYFQYRQGLEKD